MTKEEYFKYSVKQDFVKDMNWYIAVLGLPATEEVDNQYYTYKDNKFLLKLEDGDEYLIDSYKTGTVFTLYDEIVLTTDDLPYLTEELVTTVGIAIANFILVKNPFNDKIEFINGELTVKHIETEVVKKLTNDTTAIKDITVPEYIKYVDNTSFLSGFSLLVTISATYKAIVAPPGIREYKAKIIKEFKEKYGEDVFQSYTRINEFEQLLREYDDKWLKDDPSYNKLTSGKVKNQARSRMFLSYGAEPGFDKSGVATVIENSLEEGLPKDPVALANLYNISRAGSYYRGKETQKGGVTAKIVLRATNSVKINTNDCETTLTKSMLVNEDNKEYIVGRNIIDNGIVGVTEDNINKYMNKVIKLRSPAYCLEDGRNICSTCAGKRLTDYRTGISLLVLDVSSIILAISMGAMHGVQLKTVKLELDDMVS